MKFTVNGAEKEFFIEERAGRLDLMVADSGRTSWFVVGITGDGKLVRYCSVPNDLGLRLNYLGQVKVDKGA